MELVRKIWKDMVVILCFFILVILMIYPLYKSGSINAISDWPFHASRVQEIYLNLKQGHWLTFIATHTFHKTGVGSFLFYPTVFLYPWAVFKLFFSPVTAFYLWLSIFLYLSLIICYFSSKLLVRKSLQAVFISVIYTVMPYHIYLSQGIFGEFMAITFLPLFLIGVYQILFEKKNSWILTSSGIALIIYCHVISSLISISVALLLLIISLIYNRGISKSQLRTILTSVFVAMLMILPIIIPFLTDYINGNVYSTSLGINLNLTPTLKDTIIGSFSMSFPAVIGSVLVTGMLSGFIDYKNKVSLTCWGIGVFFLLMSTKTFPWNLLQNSMLGIIQLPYRFTPYAGLFLAINFSYLLQETFTRIESSGNISFLLFMVSILLIVPYYHYSDLKALHWLPQENGGLTLKRVDKELKSSPGQFLLNNNNYNEIFNYGVWFGEFDYYPIKAHLKTDYNTFDAGISKDKPASIVRNVTFINNHKINLRYSTMANGITYYGNFTNGDSINLPILSYHRTEVYDEKGKIPYQISNRGTVSTTLNRNTDKIQVVYKPSLAYYIALVVSSLTWIVVLGKLRLLRNKDESN